jgi:cytochrome c5
LFNKKGRNAGNGANAVRLDECSLGDRASNRASLVLVVLSADFHFLAGSHRNGRHRGKWFVVLVSLSPIFEYLSVRSVRHWSDANLHFRCLDLAARKDLKLIASTIMHRVSFVSLLFLLATPTAVAQDQAPIDAGAAVYENYCSGCHGPRLRNAGTSFDLRELTEGDRERFDIGVMDGKNMMPPWRGTVSDEELDQLWAYIRAYAYE